MPAWLECDQCGHDHEIPDRSFESGVGTRCPECGGRSYTVRHEGLEWRPAG